MITNDGKNIIAKYLIGDAPAYASFMALGCGRKPRPNVTTLSNVNTFLYTGTISSVSTTTTITGLSSTTGLLVGMTIARETGTGEFGGTPPIATIKSIDSSTQITVETTDSNTTGSITFFVMGTFSILQVEAVSALWEGARLSQISSTSGSLSTTGNAIVDKILSPTLIRVTPGSDTTKLSNAQLKIDTDPSIKSLEFESLRVPIISRGYVNDNGTNKIVLTAQLPSEERYEFTEIGIYSAGSNRSAGAFDSKTITAFAGTEAWEISADNTVSGPSLTNPLFQEYDISIINSANRITSEAPAIKIKASNGVFANDVRVARYERPRYLDNVYLLRGDTSFIYKQNSSFVIADNPKFLQLSGQVVDLTKNSSSDLLKLAFTVVSVDGPSIETPDNVYVVVEFSNSDGSQFAKMQVEVTPENYDLANNRYVVATKKLEELFYSSQFSWKTVNTIKIYASATKTIFITNKFGDGEVGRLTTNVAHNLVEGDTVFVSGCGTGFDGIRVVTAVPSATTFEFETDAVAIQQEVNPLGRLQQSSNAFYVALDALRLDNINTVNPLYGLVGYSIVQDSLQRTIVKSPNTTNFIEYRFVLDVT